MAYSDFTISKLQHDIGLTIIERENLFSGVEEIELPEHLASTLIRYLPLSQNMNTEKGRSELLIAPVLIEMKLRHPDTISLFSGIEFSVDPSVGLNGRCDFILSRNPLQLALTAPVCMLMEAKKEDILAGIPQCLAEMVAAQRFNRAEGIPEWPIYGVVTTGILWRFLRLDGAKATVDNTEYFIRTPVPIFSILNAMVLGQIPAL